MFGNSFETLATEMSSRSSNKSALVALVARAKGSATVSTVQVLQAAKLQVEATEKAAIDPQPEITALAASTQSSQAAADERLEKCSEPTLPSESPVFATLAVLAGAKRSRDDSASNHGRDVHTFQHATIATAPVASAAAQAATATSAAYALAVQREKSLAAIAAAFAEGDLTPEQFTVMTAALSKV